MGERLSFEEPSIESLSPEIQLVESVRKVEELLSWLIECGPGNDPMLVGMKRGRLIMLLDDLGFQGDGAIDMFHDLKGSLTQRATTPQPTIDVPNTDWFADRIAEIHTQKPSDGLYVPRATLSDIAEYAHTDWSGVHSRDPRMPLAEYTRRLAVIMCDPISYELTIPSAKEGVIEVGTDLDIQNGRHRSLAIRSLGTIPVTESGMAAWVPVETVPV